MPRTGRPAGAGDIERELAAAKAAIEAKQFGQAEAELKAVLGRHAGGPLAAEALFLIGQAQELDGRGDEAVATYAEFRARHKGHARWPDATYQLAQLTASRKGSERDAIKLYTALFTQYPKSPRAPEAMFAKALIEERLKLRELDPTLAVSVPMSLLTYRELTERYPSVALAEHAFFRIGNMYDELKRYDLAVRAFEALGAGFPDSRYDPWFRAGDLYERRLKDREKARAAYAKVPPSSPRYKDAQKRAAR